jgi:hypothetical protein
MVKSKTQTRKSKKITGGSSSATTYMSNLVGSMNDQFESVFGPGNTSTSNTLPLSGGSKHRRPKKTKCKHRSRKTKCKHRSRKTRGGMWGQVLNQAIVPAGLLAMQNTYGKKKKTRKANK